MKIKVVEAISDTNIGGAGVLLVNRLKHTDRSVFDTTVVLPKGSRLEERFKEIGIRVIAINGCFDKSWDIGGFLAYKRIFSRLSPHIVNSHGCLAARVAAKSSGVAVKLYTRHCVFPVSKIYKNKGIRMAVRSATKYLNDGVIAVAYSAKENLVEMGIEPQMTHVIINGAEPLRRISEEDKIALRRRYGIHTDDRVITICARLEECKDHRCFLRAAKILCGRSEKYKFFVLGDGSLRKELEELSKELGIEKKAFFVGFVNDVSPFMNLTHVNVNCSIGTETSSLALSEGMSIGIPSVVSDYGGNTYMVRDNVNGYIYRAGDYKHLAQKIEAVFDSGEYFRMSRASKFRYKRELNSEAMAKKTQELYLDMLKKKRPRL